MSLATRCSACGTVFRVVQDQLKVSEGWVRCGRCHEAFNALESLSDPEAALEVAHAVPAEVSADAPAPAGPAPAEPSAPDLPPAQPASWLSTSDAVAEVPAGPVFAEVHADHAPTAFADPPATAEPFDEVQRATVGQGHRTDLADPRNGEPPIVEVGADVGFGVEAGAKSGEPTAAAPHSEAPPAREAGAEAHREPVPDSAPDPALAPAHESGSEPALVLEPEPAPPAAGAPASMPDFLRQPEREASWEQPHTVVAMSVLCGLLALTLALQALVHFRNLLADAWPQAHPFVKAVCAAVHCSVEPVRRIEDIVIDSSALTAAASGEAVRLSLVLRNRGTQPLAMPSVELTITDADGKMLVRRALSPSDFSVASATLPASAETPLQLVLATGGRRASSYTIEPFYP